MKVGAYRTAAGSTMTVSGEHGGISFVNFDWLEEGGCYDCVVEPYDDEGELVWRCEQCGGGRATLIPDPGTPKELDALMHAYENDRVAEAAEQKLNESGKVGIPWLVWLGMLTIIILANVPEWLKSPNWVEYSTLAGGVALLLVSVFRACWNKYRSEHWYRIRHAVTNLSNPPGQPYDFLDSREPIVGRSVITVIIEPRGKVALDRFDIRLVTFSQGVRQKPTDAPITVIELLDVSLPSNRVTQGVTIQSERNAGGGLNCVLSKEIHLTRSERLVLNLKIETHQDWCGYVGFRAASHGDSEERVYVHLDANP